MKHDLYQMLEKKVKSQLKMAGISDNKMIDEFTESCLDDFNLALESGKTKVEAINQALTNLNDSLIAANAMKVKIYKYKYSLIIVLIVFFESLVTSVIGWLVADVLSVLGVVYPILFLTSLVILIFGIVTFRKRNVLDFLISIVLFLASLSIFVECLLFFYRARTGDFYYSLFYTFPGILSLNRNVLVSLEPMKYELTSSILLFDPTLVVSFLCLITSLVFNIVERRRKYVNNNIS